MASGVKARFFLNDTAEHLIWTVDADCTINLRYANQVAGPNAITVAISPNASSSSAQADIITPGGRIAANGILEDIGIPVSAGEKIFGKALVAGISVRVMGP